MLAAGSFTVLRGSRPRSWSRRSDVTRRGADRHFETGYNAGLESSNLDHIRSYYEALNTGDPDLVASHFTEDAVHYYTRLGPHVGAERIGQNSKMGVEDDRRAVVPRARDRAG